MGKRAHDLRNKLQLAMLDLPAGYSSGDLMRCFADATVKFMEEVAPEPKPYEVKTKGVVGQEYIVFYNDHGAVYGVPKKIVEEQYKKLPLWQQKDLEREETLERYLVEWMSKEEYLPHLIMLKPAEDFDYLLKNLELVENVHTITLDEDSYSR